MRLFGELILVEPLPQKLQSSGGILFAERYRDDRKQFKVLAVGPGRRLKNGSVIPLEIKPGDHVLAELYTDTRYEFEDGRKIIDAKQCVAVWPQP